MSKVTTRRPSHQQIAKLRNTNLELFRIIVMLLIVAHHYVVNSGLMWGGQLEEDYWSVRSVSFWLFGMWGKTGINCFVMITGYFMCKSQITLRKFLKLVLQVIFYDLVIYGAFFAFGYEDASLKNWLLHLLPVKGVEDSFTSCFLLFWLAIPFLNIAVKNMSRRQHLLLIALLLFTYTVMEYVPQSTVRMNYVSWFATLYFIASYLRLYPEYVWCATSARAWGWLSSVTILLAVGSVLATLYIDQTMGKNRFPYWLVSDSNAILALAIGVSTFMFFKNLHIPHSRLINTIGATTFGVFLIHANSDLMRQWLWGDVVDCVGHYSATHYYIYAPLAVLAVFAAGSLIDYVRIKTVEQWTFRLIDKHIQNR